MGNISRTLWLKLDVEWLASSPSADHEPRCRARRGNACCVPHVHIPACRHAGRLASRARGHRQTWEVDNEAFCTRRSDARVRGRGACRRGCSAPEAALVARRLSVALPGSSNHPRRSAQTTEEAQPEEAAPSELPGAKQAPRQKQRPKKSQRSSRSTEGGELGRRHHAKTPRRKRNPKKHKHEKAERRRSEPGRHVGRL